jgi:hypothetical protein
MLNARHLIVQYHDETRGAQRWYHGRKTIQVPGGPATGDSQASPFSPPSALVSYSMMGWWRDDANVDKNIS